MLAAAGTAQELRKAQIGEDIARYKTQLADRTSKYKGRSGRYSGTDSRKRATAEEAIKYLYDGVTLQEGRDKLSAGGSRPRPRPPAPLYAMRSTTPLNLAAGSTAAVPLARRRLQHLVAPQQTSRRTTTRTSRTRTSSTSSLRLHRGCSTPGRRSRRCTRAVARTSAADSGGTPRSTLCSSAGPRTRWAWSRWWCTTRTGPTAASVACAPCTGGTARKTSARPAWPVRVKPSNARSVRARASNF